jgi:hypothetical protein
LEQPDSPTSSPTAVAPAPAPVLATTRPRPAHGNPIDKFEPEGRIDFTATASGPIDLRGKNPWQEIRHEIIAYPRGFSLRPKNFQRPIENIDGGEVRLVNGTSIFPELRGKYADDDLRLRGARLPAEGLPKLQRWQEISGVITFHPPLRNYSPKFDKILDLLNPSGPFLVAGSYTLDRTDRSAEPKHTYDLIVSSDTGALTVSPRKITFGKIRGDATVTSSGVDVERAQAEVLGGSVQMSGAWRNDAPDADSSLYQGEATFRDVDLNKLEEQLRDDPPRRPMQGRLFIEGSFGGVVKRHAAAADDLKALQSGGQFEVVQGSLFQLPVLKHVSGEIKGLKQAATVGDAAARFQIEDGEVNLSEVAINSPVLGLQGGGTVGLLEHNPLNLEVVAAPLADWRDKLKETRIPLISNAVGEIAGGIQKLLNTATGTLLYQFRIGGDLKDVKVSTVPAPALTDTAALVFGRMLNARKDERPLNWIKPDEKPAK